MPDAPNRLIADRLEETARLLAEQGADRFRVAAYREAAATLRALARPIPEILRTEGTGGLEALPGIGPSLARAIREVVATGRLGMLDRLRGESDPLTLLASVPGMGATLAERVHHRLGIGTLEELEAAAHDGRLARIAGIGAKRLVGIREALAARLGRVRGPGPEDRFPAPPVAELLAVDREYRAGAEAGTLPLIAPRRFNPAHEAWLPVLHTQRGERHYTALFSNTARAHQLGRTRDWVVLYVDGGRGTSVERQFTVITGRLGALRGKRIVRGRESECAEHYRPGAAAKMEPAPV